MKLRANLAAPILAMSMCLFAAATARAEVYYLRAPRAASMSTPTSSAYPINAVPSREFIRATHSGRLSGGTISSMADITDSAG